jgi:BNR/Asp-box repeat protein
VESLESLLRDEFDRPVVPVRESVTGLISNTRRIRRRRNIASSAAAFVAVVAVAAVVTTLINAPSRPVDPAHQPHTVPTAINPSAFAKLGQAMALSPGIPTAGEMFDAQHGLLLLMRCKNIDATSDVAPACTARLDATTDGGATFAALPPLPVTNAMIGTTQLYLFDAEHLVLDQPAGIDPSALIAAEGSAGPSGFPTGLPSGFPTDFSSGSFTAPPGGFPSDFPTDYPTDLPTVPAERWASADGGMTWQKVSTKPVGTVDTVPVGDQLVVAFSYVDVASEKSPADVFAMDPDGTTHTLAHAPAATPMADDAAGSPFGAPNVVAGSYFLNGNDDGSLLVSTDQGATWHKVHTPGSDGDLSVIGGTSGRMYGDLSTDGDEPDVLVVSTDRGLTWKTVTMPPLTPVMSPAPNQGPSAGDDGGDDSSDFNSMAVLPNGDVLLTDGVQLWRLAAGAQAFQRVNEDVTTLLVIGITGGVLAFRGDTTKVNPYLTADGSHWTPSKIG